MLRLFKPAGVLATELEEPLAAEPLGPKPRTLAKLT
jgi:hypothetical protein